MWKYILIQSTKLKPENLRLASIQMHETSYFKEKRREKKKEFQLADSKSIMQNGNICKGSEVADYKEGKV